MLFWHDSLPGLEVGAYFAKTIYDRGDQGPVEDITEYVRSLSFTRGRRDRLAQIEPAELRMTLDNLDRRFDGENTAGPYYPNVKPRKRVRVRANWPGPHDVDTHQLVHVFANQWKPAWSPSGDAVVQFRGRDRLDQLAREQLQGLAYSQEITGTRIVRVLRDELGIDVGELNIEPGDHTVTAETASTAEAEGTAVGSALTYLQAVAAAEPGQFFYSRDGLLTFHDRRHRLDDEATVQLTFGDDPGDPSEHGYREIQTANDDTLLWNRITVGYQPTTYHSGVTEEQAADETSRLAYGRLDRKIDTRLVKPGEAAAVASLELYRYKQPELRVPGILTTPLGDVWDTILRLEIGQRVQVILRPPGGGDPITRECHVEGITYTIERGRLWRVQLDLSKAEDATTFWTLNQSKLGTETIVGY